MIDINKKYRTRALHEAMRQPREIYAANILNGAKT
jgi:hypothetical protein